MTVSPQTNSALARLKHVDGPQLSETLKGLLVRGEALDKIAEIIEKRIEGGAFVLNEPLAVLIGRTKSGSLHAKARLQLFKDDWALLTLYQSQYPDPEIEKVICERLYDSAFNNAEPRRRHIVEAMHEVASPAVLPTLEAILYDHAPTLKTKQLIAEAMDSAGVRGLDTLLAAIEIGSCKEFLEAVTAAIAAIKERDTQPIPNTMKPAASVSIPTDQERELYNAMAAREQAQRYLEKDPIVAIMCARRGAEALGKHLYRLSGHERKGRPARTMTLEELLKPVGDSDVPEVFKHCLKTLQLFGNFAAHDQDSQCQYLTTHIAGSLLTLYDHAMNIYREWIRSKSSY